MPREWLESPGPILIVLRERDRELWERKRNRGMSKCIAAKAAFRNVIGWREREERKDGSAPTIFRKTPHPTKGDYSRSLKIRHFVFRMVPFGSFFCSISHAGEKEKKERERERDSATEDKGAVGLIVRMDSDPSGSPNRGWGANGLSDQIDRYILNYNMQKAVSVFPFLFYREGESERAF